RVARAPSRRPYEQRDTGAAGQGEGEARGECSSEQASLPLTLPGGDPARALPEAETEVSVVAELEGLPERTRHVDWGNKRAAALLGRLLRDALPASGPIPPAAGVERDDRPCGQHRDDPHHAELRRGAHDRLHLVALGDGRSEEHTSELQSR